MISPKFVKLVAWYDNEYGYSSKLLDLIATMYKKDHTKTSTIKQEPQVKATKKAVATTKAVKPAKTKGNTKKTVSQKTVKKPTSKKK